MVDPRAWNPWHGCRRYSEGCEHCYMYFLDEVRGVPEKSAEIVRTKDVWKPLAKDSRGRYKIPPGFLLRVNMTSDTFLEEADGWRADMWEAIRRRPDVVFYIITKRAHRIMECLPDDWGDGYDNVILNISVENQRAFDERWPILEGIPAKHKGINLSPLIGEVDISPALASGQVDDVNLSGEGYGGRRPCRYEWMERVSRDCERYHVNLTVDAVGSVFIKDGFRYEADSIPTQSKWAFNTGLSRFYDRTKYVLRSPVDGHVLSEDELLKPVYNRDRCMQCSGRPSCTGCVDCGNCKNVVFVDVDGNPIDETKGKQGTRPLEEFF